MGITSLLYRFLELILKFFDCVFSQVAKLYKESIIPTGDLLSLMFIGKLTSNGIRKAQVTNYNVQTFSIATAQDSDAGDMRNFLRALKSHMTGP
jgi:hypothetical protein